MHLKRLIVAVVLLPVIYLYIMYLPSGYFILLLIFSSVIAMLEFYSMYRVTGILRYAGLFLGAFILSVSYISEDLLLNVVIFSIMTIMAIRLFAKRNPLSSLKDISPSVIGLLYIPGFFAFQTQIRRLGPEWIIFLYASVWMSDTMAYYLGTSFGKRRLYIEVSPNKTVMGAAGSLVGGVIAALILRATIIPLLTLSYAVLSGIMIGTISIIGDLVESMFKRDAGVKDSGIIIPGHGGVLDKIDGVLFAGPMLYWMLKVMGIMGSSIR
ncbi:MAG: phosphatidate cytidylyltransferase [Nitrospirota bacterium]